MAVSHSPVFSQTLNLPVNCHPCGDHLAQVHQGKPVLLVTIEQYNKKKWIGRKTTRACVHCLQWASHTARSSMEWVALITSSRLRHCCLGLVQEHASHHQLLLVKEKEDITTDGWLSVNGIYSNCTYTIGEVPYLGELLTNCNPLSRHDGTFT